MIKHYTLTGPDGKGSTPLVQEAFLAVNAAGLNGMAILTQELISFDSGKRLDMVVEYADTPAPKPEPDAMDGMD